MRQQMNGEIFTYMPRERATDEFVIERNQALAQYLASITGRIFAGEIFSPRRLGSGDYLLPHKPISLEEGRQFGIINPDQIFGAVIEPIYAEKSIFHKTVPNAKFVPSKFPHEFATFLNDKGIVLIGYTAFSIEDVEKAYDLITDAGYAVRVKHPLGSSSTKQFRAKSKKQVLDFVRSEEVATLRKFGMILEVNLLNPNDKRADVEGFSGGWTQLEGNIYSYLGRQMFAETGTTDRYIGTRLQMVRGSVDNLGEVADSLVYQDVYRQLEKVAEATKLLPYLIGSRMNFDFIYGVREGIDGIILDESPSVYVVEQSFRVGGASGAELVGIEYLKNNHEEASVTAVSRVHYGKEEEGQIGLRDKVFLRKANDPEYGEVQVWGHIYG